MGMPREFLRACTDWAYFPPGCVYYHIEAADGITYFLQATVRNWIHPLGANPVNFEPQQSEETAVLRMLSAFKEKRDGIYESVKRSIPRYGFEPWFGELTELEPLPSEKWEITKVKSKVTGVAWFSIQSEKHKGNIRITWERYPNGACFAQIIDYALTEWKAGQDGYYRIKKNSETEFELIMGVKRKKFIREARPLINGSTGYAYKSGECIKGCRMTRQKQWIRRDQVDG